MGDEYDEMVQEFQVAVKTIGAAMRAQPQLIYGIIAIVAMGKKLENHLKLHNMEAVLNIVKEMEKEVQFSFEMNKQ